MEWNCYFFCLWKFQITNDRCSNTIWSHSFFTVSHSQLIHGQIIIVILVNDFITFHSGVLVTILYFNHWWATPQVCYDDDNKWLVISFCTFSECPNLPAVVHYRSPHQLMKYSTFLHQIQLLHLHRHILLVAGQQAIALLRQMESSDRSMIVFFSVAFKGSGRLRLKYIFGLGCATNASGVHSCGSRNFSKRGKPGPFNPLLGSGSKECWGQSPPEAEAKCQIAVQIWFGSLQFVDKHGAFQKFNIQYSVTVTVVGWLRFGWVQNFWCGHDKNFIEKLSKLPLKLLNLPTRPTKKEFLVCFWI